MMSTQSQMPRQDLYQEMLSSFLHSGSEVALNIAYEFGREDLKRGVGILELTELHQQALAKELGAAESSNSERVEMNRAASRFLKETLCSFEVSRLCSKQSNVALTRLYEVFEDEAKRIAHRLHDESAQVLAVIYMELAEIAKSATVDTARRLGGVVLHLDEVSSQLRDLSHELRPLILDQLGLVPALRTLIDGIGKRSQLNIAIGGSTEGRLSPELETVMYRAVQEALTNTCRHACATQADVLVWRDEKSVHCAVSDNGRGFKMDSGAMALSQGLGLVGIRERTMALGGSCTLTSQPGHGTTVQVTIPL